MGHDDRPGVALVVTNRGAGAVGDRLVAEVLDGVLATTARSRALRSPTPGRPSNRSAVRFSGLRPRLSYRSAATVPRDRLRRAWFGAPGSGLAAIRCRPAASASRRCWCCRRGRGNSLYSLLWRETPWEAALKAVFAGAAAQLRADLIRLREVDHASVLGANFGLFADAAKRVEQMKGEEGEGGESVGADQRYAAAFADALNDLQPFDVRVTVDSETVHSGVVSMVTVGGVPGFVGGKTRLLPKAAIDDGLLDVCVVEAHTADELSALAPLVVAGDHIGQPGVHYAQGRQVLVERLDGADLSVEHDGDPWPAAATVTLDVMPGVVSLLAAADRG